MCSPNVHYEHFFSQPSSSSSRIHNDGISSLNQARLVGTSSLPSASNTKPSVAACTAALLSHTINHHSSVLSLAVDDRRNLLYSGSQEGDINVWDLTAFQSIAQLRGHTASVLALEVAPEKNWLFSSSGDNTVRIWDTLTNSPLFVVYPADDNVGDIFALKWCPTLETLYIGCQSTSIQWICLVGLDKQKHHGRGWAGTVGESPGHCRLNDELESETAAWTGLDSPIISTPDLVSRPHKFFDSVPVALSRSGMGTAGTSTPVRTSNKPHAVTTLSSVKAATHQGTPPNTGFGASLQAKGAIPTPGATESVLHAASQRLDDDAAAAAAAAAAAVSSTAPESTDVAAEHGTDSVRTLLVPPSSSVPSAHFGYVYCFALLTLEGDTQHPMVLASGSGDETIKLWHATRSGLSLLATLESPNADGNAVLALASWKTTLFSGLQGGEVEVWDLETCTLVRTIRAHTDDVICLETCPESGLLFTAGADGKVHTWDRSFRCISKLQTHDGIVLSLAKVRGLIPGDVNTAADADQEEASPIPYRQTPKVAQLITGSSDNLIKIWDTVPVLAAASSSSIRQTTTSALRRETERLSLDNATPRLNSMPMSSGNVSAEIVGSEATSILAVTCNGSSGEVASAQWPLLRSLLRKFISYPSISSSEEHREDCRQAAHFLKTCFQELGAEARILPNPVGTNPLVLATFKANAYRSRRRRTAAANLDRSRSASTSTTTSTATTPSTESSDSYLDADRSTLGEDDTDEGEGLSRSIMFDHLQTPIAEEDGGGDDDDGRASRPRRKQRCLFYGHYDCIAAEGSWTSDPFTLDGRDGYLYGRGVSDNKGPILAAACAVHHLLSTRRLYSDVVFLIEGEEENGSVGFVEAVRRYKSEIGEIDVVLLSNSYWLDEETPCLTIGLRGVVRATVSVTSGDRDVHSGVQGGAIREPMVDMVKLLAQLTGQGEQVALPGFYDAVRLTTDSEIQAYKDIVRIKRSLKSASSDDETVESLMAKWRNPSLSVHNIRVSGPGNSTVIPSSVSAQVSLRLVPDQDLPTIEASLLDHVNNTFDSLYPTLTRPSIKNKVSLSVDHRADWWLGSDSSRYFQLLRQAVKQEWLAEPISIREGGSIPAIAILEKELGACAVHLPMGQSSDNAHLPNERLRQRNLVKGQNVVRRFIQGLAGI